MSFSPTKSPSRNSGALSQLVIRPFRENAEAPCSSAGNTAPSGHSAAAAWSVNGSIDPVAPRQPATGYGAPSHRGSTGRKGEPSTAG